MAKLLIEVQIGNRKYEYEVKNYENLKKVTLVPYPNVSGDAEGGAPRAFSISHEDLTVIWRGI